MSLKISVILITNDYARSNTETLGEFPREPSNACVLLLETASMHECIKCKEYVCTDNSNILFTTINPDINDE